MLTRTLLLRRALTARIPHTHPRRLLHATTQVSYPRDRSGAIASTSKRAAAPVVPDEEIMKQLLEGVDLVEEQQGEEQQGEPADMSAVLEKFRSGLPEDIQGLIEDIEGDVDLEEAPEKPPTARELMEDPEWHDDLGDSNFQYDDIPTQGHDVIADERQYIEYMRYIEIEGPELEKYRQPFTPLANLPIRLRTIGYGGELHPAARKVALTCPVSALRLKPEVLHKFKLLASARWSPFPPLDAGITKQDHETEGKEGWFKISCEQFPHQAQNAKWCSDKLDQLVKEANRKPKYFASVPVDMRHVHVREKKHPRHTHVRKSDFPLDWIPAELREEARRNGDAKEKVERLPPH